MTSQTVAQYAGKKDEFALRCTPVTLIPKLAPKVRHIHEIMII